MSIDALTWAHLQDTRRPSWQNMLYVLAHSADPECIAFHWWKSDDHWWPYLMWHTGMSRSSVFRVLVELEAVDLISRGTSTNGKIIQNVVILNSKLVLVWSEEKKKLESHHRTQTGLELIGPTDLSKLKEKQKITKKDSAVRKDESHGETRIFSAGLSPTIGLDESHGRTPIKNQSMNQIQPPLPPAGSVRGFVPQYSDDGAAIRALSALLGHIEVQDFWRGRSDDNKVRGYRIWFELTPQLRALAQVPPADQWVEYPAYSPEHRRWLEIIPSGIKAGKMVKKDRVRLPWQWPPTKNGALSAVATRESEPDLPLSAEDADALIRGG